MLLMPNHIQGVIFIDKTPVETQDFASLQTPFSRQDDCRYEIPDHFPIVKLGTFVVMPNHIHGIIIIDKTPVETQDFASLQTMFIH
jgi:hypothetical protein